MIRHALAVVLALMTINVVCAGPASSHAPALIQMGAAEDGLPTRLWMAAIESRNTAEHLSIIRDTERLFTAAEKEWLALFRREIPKWTETIPRLTIPFEELPAPETVTILVGNQGGDDGFTHGTSIICLDLSSWARSYGQASDPVNVGRVHRILSHEYTHLMSRAWIELHPPNLSTPLCRALFSIYFEGLGNYYSLSEKWYEPSVGLSERALDALEELGPTFVDRLLQLNEVTPEQEEQLREGLSAGPFHKKWGALPAALWLRKEAGNDPRQLRKWVKAGPCGMLDLASRYLPEHLGERLQALECDCLAPHHR
jgi:hypothetical protein